MKLVRAYLVPLLVYQILAQDDASEPSEDQAALLRGRRNRNRNRNRQQQQVEEEEIEDFAAVRTIKLPGDREKNLRGTAVAAKFKVNLWDLRELARKDEQEKQDILTAKLNNERDGFGTFSGSFDATYYKRMQKAPITETLVRAIQERDHLELSGQAPKPKHFTEYGKSTVVKTDLDEAVCRISDAGVVCESPSFHEGEGEGAGPGLRRRKKKKKRRKKKPASGASSSGGGKKKKKKKKSTFGKWKDNGLGMLCNGYKCKPKPTRFPQTTTVQPKEDGHLGDTWGRISFDKLYKTLIELNKVHPVKNFKYLNLNGNLLVGDIEKLEDILCLMPQVKEVSFQACGMQGILPPNTFRCVKDLQKADFFENGFWCAKGVFDQALKHTGIDYDGKPTWSLKHINFEMNPMQGRCYFVKSGEKPHTIAKKWDFDTLRQTPAKVTINEWSDSMLDCINNEPNCETNRPEIDLAFF